MSISTREDKQHASKFANVMASAPASAQLPARRRRRVPRWLRWLMILTLTIVGGGLLVGTLGSRVLNDDALARNYLTEPVRRADLIVSVTEDGTMESSHNIDIKCEVQKGSTILWIIPDGTEVKKGEDLIRLDSAPIQEQIDLQKIATEKARALMIEAEKNYESAKIAVQEYLEGMFVQELKTLQVAATVAKENLESARNTSRFTNRMHRKGYVTSLQRDADEFAVKRAQLDLEVAETAITVLERFTKPKTQVGLESVRDSAEAKMASEKAAFELEHDRLEKLEVERERCLIKAPADGMVVYNSQQGRRSEPIVIEEGAIVRERQTIVRLPDLSQMQVKCSVHESKIDNLQRGMRARIEVQDREFQGVVTSIANQPQPTNWFSGSVKEYAAIVAIESESAGLRPGMTAAVEILVENLEDVLSVPVQSIVQQKGDFYCWVQVPDQGVEKREIKLGSGNNTRMQVLSGLEEGEQVLLNPRESIAEAGEEERDEEAVDVKARFGGDRPAKLPDSNRGGSGGKKKQSGRPGGFKLSDFDEDGDNKISPDEAPGSLKEVFGRVDGDGDGFLDAAEWAAMRRKFQEMRQKMQQNMGQ